MAMRSILVQCVLVSVIAMAYGADLLKEDFGCSCREENWNVLNTGTSVTGSVGDGAYRMKNTGDQPGITLYSPKTFENMTYSVSLLPDNPAYQQTGIVFGWDVVTGSGYEFSVSDDQTYLLRAYSKGSSGPPLAMSAHSFVNTGANRLTVSRRDSSISLLANGVFLTSLTSSAAGAGNIGLLCGSGAEVRFDDVAVTDAYLSGSPLSRYEDDFNDGDYNGWSTRSLRGTASITDDRLVLAHDDGSEYISIIYVDGGFAASPVSVVVRRESGPADALYGIRLMEIRREMSGGGYTLDYTDGTVFAVNGSKQFAVYSSGDTGYVPEQSQWLHGEGGSDTLEITADRAFKANGHLLTEFSGMEFEYNAVALLVSPGLTAAFDDVSVSADPSSVVFRPAGAGRSVSRLSFPVEDRFDMLGRLRGTGPPDRNGGMDGQPAREGAGAPGILVGSGSRIGIVR